MSEKKDNRASSQFNDDVWSMNYQLLLVCLSKLPLEIIGYTISTQFHSLSEIPPLERIDENVLL